MMKFLSIFLQLLSNLIKKLCSASLLWVQRIHYLQSNAHFEKKNFLNVC